MTDDFFVPVLPEETVYHVGVSGGKDSTAVLLWMIHESGIPHHKIDVTFADTGNEHEDTYAQIKLLNDTVFPIQTLQPVQQGFPARSILLLNRALGAELDGSEPVLRQWPLPYLAIGWLLNHHLPEHFMGNPRRHWQHLATRMSGPRVELRTWRAWACWRMACVALPDLPADEKQLAEEGVREPGEERIAGHLEQLGHPGEVGLWREVLEGLGGDTAGSGSGDSRSGARP